MDLSDFIEGCLNRLFPDEMEDFIFKILAMIPDREFYLVDIHEKRFRDYQLDIAGLVQENRATRGRVGFALKLVIKEYEEELRKHAEAGRFLLLFDVLLLKGNHQMARKISGIAERYRLEERIRQFNFDDFVFRCRRGLD